MFANILRGGCGGKHHESFRPPRALQPDGDQYAHILHRKRRLSSVDIESAAAPFIFADRTAGRCSCAASAAAAAVDVIVCRRVVIGYKSVSLAVGHSELQALVVAARPRLQVLLSVAVASNEQVDWIGGRQV